MLSGAWRLTGSLPCLLQTSLLPSRLVTNSFSYQVELERPLNRENSPFTLYFLCSFLIFSQEPFETAQVLNSLALKLQAYFPNETPDFQRQKGITAGQSH